MAGSRQEDKILVNLFLKHLAVDLTIPLSASFYLDKVHAVSLKIYLNQVANTHCI